MNKYVTKKNNKILIVPFAVSIITTYLNNKEVAKCFLLSKNITLIIMDNASDIFFKHKRRTKASILGFEFLLSIAKKRFSPSKNIDKHICIKCCIYYKNKNSLYCVSCLQKNLKINVFVSNNIENLLPLN